jgi:glucose-6-phosphate 1-dehydrogenase
MREADYERTHNRKIAVGKIGDTVIPAYRESKDVEHDSTTETYVVLKRQIDNWRWAAFPSICAPSA